MITDENAVWVIVGAVIVTALYIAGVGWLVWKDSQWRRVDGYRAWDDDAD